MSARPHGYNAQAPAAPRRILVVDDSRPTVRALAALLDGAGYATAVALSGAGALAHARRGGRFSGVIVDVHLPDISGLVVSRQLREILGPDVPIIILSGDSSMQTLNSLPHAGATYFFSKPVNSGELLGRLKEFVEEGSQK